MTEEDIQPLFTTPAEAVKQKHVYPLPGVVHGEVSWQTRMLPGEVVQAARQAGHDVGEPGTVRGLDPEEFALHGL